MNLPPIRLALVQLTLSHMLAPPFPQKFLFFFSKKRDEKKRNLTRKTSHI